MDDSEECGWERRSYSSSRGVNAPWAVSSGSLGPPLLPGSSLRDTSASVRPPAAPADNIEENEVGRHLYRERSLVCHDRGTVDLSGRNPIRKLASARRAVDVSLREWLDDPARTVELLECLHVFRQIAEMVGYAHAQGVAVHNVRPSCFVLSASYGVSFMDSASCSTSGGSASDSVGEAPSAYPGRSWCSSSLETLYAGGVGLRLREGNDPPSSSTGWLGSSASWPAPVLKSATFLSKKIRLQELNWYTSPDEASGDAGSLASDVYRLGVLLFELFCTYNSLEEKLRTMSNLRHRVLPPEILLRWPKEASFCLWLLHPQPNNRPKLSEVLKSDFLNGPRDNIADREAATKLQEEIEDQELLHEFLVHLQQRKQEAADKLHDIVCCLSSDIEEVSKQQSLLMKKVSSLQEWDNSDHSELGVELPLLCPEGGEDSASTGSRKRFRLRPSIFHPEKAGVESLTLDTHLKLKESMLSKSTRLMRNFKKLESAYFLTRCRMSKLPGKVQARNLPVGSARESIARTEGSSVDDLACKTSPHGERKSAWINPFLEGLCKYLSFSRLNVRADVRQGDLLNSSNLVCCLAFDRDKELFATAGVNKKIKIFECDSILNGDRDIHYPVVEMASRSKLSSVCWNSYIKNQIASSDFEGVVQVWDAARGQIYVEMKEHERRVWSVDFSLADPTKLASGSDDGTVKLWHINQAGSIGTIRMKANVCSVQFPPDSGRSLAIGSADHRIYYYDLRNLRIPLYTLVGHTKTVSYVKFMDSSTLVSASTDSSIKLWDLSSSSRVIDNPLQTYTGHTNIKNFVGLSISDGYIATGSETNEVFVYHKAFPMPMLSFRFSSSERVSVGEVDDAPQFISSVCWRGQASTLIAANSSGNIKLLDMA